MPKKDVLTGDGYADNAQGARERIDDMMRMISAYRRLHAGLTDMIDGGRLRCFDIPDDCGWLKVALSEAAQADEAVRQGTDA